MRKDVKCQADHGIVRQHQLVFPLHQQVPLRGKMALWLLKSCQARVVDVVKDVKKGKKNGNTKTS